MELGSKEWIERVNEIYSFPCKVAFVLIKEEDGTTGIFSTLIKSSARLENIKYSHISKETWTSEASAVLEVKEVKDAYEYLGETKRLSDIWEFAIIKKKPLA